MTWDTLIDRFIADRTTANPGPRRPGTHLAGWFRHRDYFAIADHPQLEAFEDLAGYHPPDTAEPSVKVTPHQIHAARLNLYYHDISTRPELAAKLLYFLRDQAGEQSTALRDVLKDLVARGLRLCDCDHMVVGVDLRPDIATTRHKLWFVFKEAQPARLFYQLPCAGPEPERALMYPRTYLVGLDLTSTGQVAAKVYPAFALAELEKLRQRFGWGPETMALAARTPITMVSLWPSPILHLMLSGSLISERLAHPLARDLSHQSGYILSASPAEIEAQDIRHFNLYFKMGGTPAGLHTY